MALFTRHSSRKAQYCYHRAEPYTRQRSDLASHYRFDWKSRRSKQLRPCHLVTPWPFRVAEGEPSFPSGVAHSFPGQPVVSFRVTAVYGPDSSYLHHRRPERLPTSCSSFSFPPDSFPYCLCLRPYSHSDPWSLVPALRYLRKGIH